jgi:hypothetical protein
MPEPTSPPADSAPLTCKEVLERELEQIRESRRARGVVTSRNTGDSLIGLAFSGGGIRSATFNLGVLQALAESRLLHKFDYLSTVSGGGYIGSWLAGVTRRFLDSGPGATFADVEQSLIPEAFETDQRRERSFLHWLRQYSNYLTPHKGLISGDTWAMLGTWLRNVFLNQCILGLIFVGAFVLCQGVLLFLVKTEEFGKQFLEIGGVFLFVAAVLMAADVAEQTTFIARPPSWFQRIKVTLTVMLPFVLAAVFLNCGLWQWLDLSSRFSLLDWAGAGAVFYLVVWGVTALAAESSRLFRKHQSQEQKRVSIWALLIFSPVAGAIGACLLKEYNLLLSHLPPWTSTNWIVVIFGSGGVMLALLITGTLHQGLVGRGSKDLVREWWARLGGYLTLVTMGWLLVAGTCAFGPLLVRWALFRLSGAKSIATLLFWIANNYLGLKAAGSARTIGEAAEARKAQPLPSEAKEETGPAARAFQFLKSPRMLEWVATVAPYIFIAGLVLLLSTAVHIGMGWLFDPDDTNQLWQLSQGPTNARWYDISDTYWDVRESTTVLPVLGVGALLVLAALALSWRVDVNEFSLHHFYRNRLVRCYLGASNGKRTPQPFTGFDPGDDLPLKSLAIDYPGPYPILNAALNITRGEELGYATTKAKSFVFTPLYCGYDLANPGEGADRFLRRNAFLGSFSPTGEGRSAGSFTTTRSEGGITVGTAMAISGAAASPNMGYFTSPVTAFFMTLFDVRLGWWMGNPRYPSKWRSAGPRLGLGYLFSELVAQSDQNRSYVYLSDGGHFENLAVYELIKRRCRLIVVCDAGCDPSYRFDHLLGLIEKARTDFGARIEIDFQAIRPRGEKGSESNFACGDIYFDPQDEKDRGRLIYIKASMPGREARDHKLPHDVWHYLERHPAFPHQTTADQWFDEVQFESYRALGECLGNQAAGEIRDHMRRVL